MPLDYVPVTVARPVSTVSATFGGSAPTLMQLAGSPFLARVYRVAQTTVGRDEAQPGTATLDEMQRLSVMDPACPIQVNDIAFLPQADGSTRRAKVLRVRRYADRTQYDLETGAEGDAPAGPGALSTLPPPAGVQAQIDALTQQFTTLQTQLASTQTQLGTLQVSFSNYQPSGVEPVVPVTAAAVTLAMPTVDTVYEVKPSANQVITLPPAPGIVNGVAPVLHLDLQQLGGFTCALALCSANAGNAGAADQYVPSTTATTTAQNIANAIASGAASISLRSLQIGFWSIE